MSPVHGLRNESNDRNEFVDRLGLSAAPLGQCFIDPIAGRMCGRATASITLVRVIRRAALMTSGVVPDPLTRAAAGC
jgi:hypothetical protein